LQENLLLKLLHRSYGATGGQTLDEQHRIDALWRAAEVAETDGAAGKAGGEPRRGKQSPDLGQVSAGSSLSSFRSSSAASGAARPQQRPPAPCPHHTVHCPEYRKVYTCILVFTYVHILAHDIHVYIVYVQYTEYSTVKTQGRL
jgi:hypothetical protein